MWEQIILHTIVEPFLSPESRTYWPGLLLTILLLCLFQWKRSLFILSTPSFWLDVQLFLGRQLLGAVFLGSSVASIWTLSTHSILWLDTHIAIPQTGTVPQALVLFLYSTTLFIVWDVSRYLLHKWMHEIPALWAFHQIHHSAEHLTPLTHHRIHPLESVLYTLRGIISTTMVVTLFYWLFREQLQGSTIIAPPIIGTILNVLVGNIRHSTLWVPYPKPIEKWLISPAQHQIHHSTAPEHHNKNYGTWLSIWDRIHGTLLLSEKQPTEFGILQHHRNHGQDIVSAWFSPFLDITKRYKHPLLLILLCITPSAALAEDTPEEQEEEEQEEQEEDGSILIYSEEGLPLEAGSAHVISEESKKQFSLQNVERLLEQVPGMSIRSEDGFGLRPNIGIRGANSDRSAKVTLMEDGILFAPAPYAAPAAYYFPMMDRITGVEVFKGAASTRHGPNTVGGAINLVSRPLPAVLTGNITLGVGSFGMQNLHAWIGTPKILVEGTYLASNGFKTLPQAASTGFQRMEITTKGQHKIGSQHTFKAKLGYAAEKSNETYLGLGQEDFSTDPYQRYAASALGNMEWDRVQATGTWLFKTDSLKLHTDIYMHNLSRVWKKFNRFSGSIDVHTLLAKESVGGQSAIFLDILRGKEDSTSPDQYLMIGTNDRRYQSKGLQSKLQWSHFGDQISYTFEGGLRLHRDDVYRKHTEVPYNMLGGALVEVEEAVTDTLLDANTQATAVAGYIHNDIAWKNLHLYPSIRMEHITTQYQNIGTPWDPSTTRFVILPGFGTLYSIDDWTDTFFGVHKGFSPVAPGQPKDVQPEESINYEIGFRNNDGTIHTEIIGFGTDYQNITGQCTFSGGCTGDSIDTQFNGGQAWIYGLESIFGYSVAINPKIALPFQATYSWTKSEFRTGFISSYPQFGQVEKGDTLPYVAEHQARVQLGIQTDVMSIYTGASYSSPMLDEAGRFDSNTITIPARLLLDASTQLHYRNISIRLVGQNLLNSRSVASYRPFGARPVLPRQFTIHVEILQ